MMLDIKSMKPEELINLYNKMDQDLNKELLSGKPWHQVKDKVDYLTEISKELTKRNISFKHGSESPADMPLRDSENRSG